MAQTKYRYLKLTIELDNAAFEENESEEVARILAEAAEKIRRWSSPLRVDEKLRDINGNTCGVMQTQTSVLHS